MREEKWTELLRTLINGTKSRKVKWRTTDGRGVYVAIFRGSSVRIQSPSSERFASRAIQALMSRGIVVELRDADGAVTDTITTSEVGLVEGISADVISARSALTDVEYESSSQATSHQTRLIEELLTQVRKSMRIGETLAQSIIEEIQ